MSIFKRMFFLSFVFAIQILAQTVPVTLHYKPIIKDFTTLRLVGNFNGWNNNDPSMVMTDTDGDGVYEITKEFTKNVEHMYKFVFDANWSFAWNDLDNPNIKITDNNNSVLNVTDPLITYLLPRGVNSAAEMYVDTTIAGEPIRAIFAYSASNPINLNSLNVTIDGITIENPAQYYIETKKEFYYQPIPALTKGEHTVVVSINSALGTITKTATFNRNPGLVIYKIPIDFYFDEYNTSTNVFQTINSVSVVGDFNNWNETFNKMDDNNKDHLWETTALVEEGNYEYKFKLNNSLWVADPDEPNFSEVNDNNSFIVIADSTPSIKLISPLEGTIYSTNPSNIICKMILRPGVKSKVNDTSIKIKLDDEVVPHNYIADSNIVFANITLGGEGTHQVNVEFTNTDGISFSSVYTYGIYTSNTGLFYADPLNDEQYNYPSGVPEGSADILSVKIDEVPTHDSLFFEIDMNKISDRTRLALLITNKNSSVASDPLKLEILTEEWQNEGVFVPFGSPGNSYLNSEKENRFWEKRDSSVISNRTLMLNSELISSNKFVFTISLAYLDSLLGSWTRERDFYSFSYLAAEDKSGNGFEVTSLEGGSDEIGDPDIYDAAFFRSGFWQNRILSNYIPLGGRMGPRTVSLNGKGRGLVSLTASDISDSLATYGPAINFLTPPVTYWYPNVTVKGNLSDPEISTITFYFNDIESIVGVTNSEFSVPLILKEGENIIYVKAKDNKNYTSISKNLVLKYEKELNPVVKIVGSISGRTISLTAESSSPDSLPINYYWIDDEKNPVHINVISLKQSISFALPSNDGEYFFKVRVRDTKSRLSWAKIQINTYGDSVYFPQINDHAAWVDSAIFYEIYPRSFSSTGDFNGIKNKIPEMLDLGINAVWLMPIYKGPTVHGYEITDYFDFEEDYGNAEDFNALVTALHSSGIKIVLDFVVNHTSIQHPFMQNVLEYKINSPWANFYLWDGEPGNSNYQYYFDWGSLPNLNHQNKDVRDYFIKAAKYWVSEFDIDGYRCDVAWGVEERNTQFWQEWRNALKNIKPELFLEAEASSSTPVFYQNRFDSANDWDLRNKLIDVTNGSVSINVLDAELRKSYPYYARPFRFVENHDEVRVASSHGTKRSKLMHTILMTANGIPLIYSGGEVGEITNRGTIDWSDPDGVRPYFKSLINMRKKYLSNPIITRIDNSFPSDVYSYISNCEYNNILTIANFKNETKKVSVYIKDLPEGTKFLTNLIDGSTIDIQPISGSVFIDLEGFEAKVFYLGEEPVSVEKEKNDILKIDEYKLDQNYPNPFNPTTKISYQIPTSGLVTLHIYDVLGREVANLVNAELNSGKHEIEFDASSLSSGIYFYRLKSGNFIDTKKLMLLK